ncbi:dol-P-Man:Man(7)GlcNAc(2)-PP-Dol alpha-1,6-mannosyltransferase isoform X4 [Elaeis guineensis]|uniref:Mannosyltransferase n=1 Tax=Elaeis guineensis var. tenera TaxID=51953 RepID=A0A6I9RWM7_ELAGV|nr:dol-P-Man:Man(7)GlcNAc(2)-PP-Dol alpha-1,6-mannosyltransferase isoform X5 [Elaeis guineensis]
MAPTKPASNEKSSEFFRNYGWDVILGTIASFYVIMIPYTKVEESFNVQAMHDMLYHHHHINNYDHLDFPGVVPRTFMGALLASILASPVVFLMHCLHMPKIYSLFAVRLVLGCIILSTLRFFRIQVRRKFGYHVEAFFVILTAVQFHLLFYSTRPLPNILAFGLVNLAYSFWFKGNALATLKCLTFATIVFRCDTLLLFAPIGIELLLAGMLLDRRILRYIVPVLSFVLLYSKLPHKELRFVISSVPVFNVSAAITASRIYINRKKNVWRELYVMMLGSLLISLGCSIMTFMASYDNYPGAYALRALHEKGASNCTVEKWVHIDAFTAMNGVSRFSENKYPWRYSKEEGIALEEYRFRNFTYLLNEHSYIDGFKCLFAVNGFYKARLQAGFPPIVLLKEPKVFVHGNARDQDIIVSAWPGCP